MDWAENWKKAGLDCLWPSHQRLAIQASATQANIAQRTLPKSVRFRVEKSHATTPNALCITTLTNFLFSPEVALPFIFPPSKQPLLNLLILFFVNKKNSSILWKLLNWPIFSSFLNWLISFSANENPSFLYIIQFGLLLLHSDDFPWWVSDEKLREKSFAARNFKIKLKKNLVSFFR